MQINLLIMSFYANSTCIFIFQYVYEYIIAWLKHIVEDNSRYRFYCTLGHSNNASSLQYIRTFILLDRFHFHKQPINMAISDMDWRIGTGNVEKPKQRNIIQSSHNNE